MLLISNNIRNQFTIVIADDHPILYKNLMMNIRHLKINDLNEVKQFALNQKEGKLIIFFIENFNFI